MPGIPLSANFDLGTGIPLDSRLVQADITARNALNTVTQRYEGMPVFVMDTGKNYQLRGGVEDANWVELVDVGEPSLGNPGVTGYVLSSTTAGVRSWIAQTSGVVPVSDILYWNSGTSKYVPYADDTVAASAGKFYLGTTFVTAADLRLNYTGGICVNSVNDTAIVGQGTAGFGVSGISGSGSGVYASSDTGIVVRIKATLGNTSDLILASLGDITKFNVDKDGNVNIPTGSSYKVNNVAIGGYWQKVGSYLLPVTAGDFIKSNASDLILSSDGSSVDHTTSYNIRIIAGDAYPTTTNQGGSIYLVPGTNENNSFRGGIYFGSGTYSALPTKTSETNVVYIDTSTGKLSYGTVLSSQWVTTGSDIYYNTGNVGIGTIAPQSLLSLGFTGTIAIPSYTTTEQGGINFFCFNGDTYTRYLDIVASGNPNSWAGDSSIRFLTNTSAIGNVPSEKMRITGWGYVGIGTTIPLTLLHLESSSPILRFNSPTAGNGAGSVQFYDQGTQQWNLTTVATSNDLAIYNNGGSGAGFNFYIKKSDGNVGIGTATPTAKLHLYGASGSVVTKYASGTNVAAVGVDNTGMYFEAQGSIPLAIYTGGSERLSILSGGNVGIGTTTPATKLHVAGDFIVNEGSKIGFRYSAGDVGPYQYITANGATSLDFHNEYTSSAGNKLYSFFTMAGTPREIVTILAGGNVGIGTATPDSILRVVDNAYGASLAIGYSTTGYNYYDAIVHNFRGASGGSGGNVYSTGSITAISFIPTSDERLKMNIIPLIPLPVKVDYFQFEFKSEPGITHYGFIAQRVQKDYPEFVRKDTEGILSLAYTDIMIKKIAYLEWKIQDLEKKFMKQ